MINKEQVKQLLGTGLSNEVVASTVGCDVSYITQLLATDEFRSEVVALRTTALTANNARDKTIDAIEDLVIKKLSDALDYVHKPGDILRMFSVINNAKRRGIPAHQSVQVNNQVVNLNIPVNVLNQFVINTQGEVVEVGGQTLVTKPAHTLLKELIADKGADNERYKEVAARLPNTVLTSSAAE